MDYFELHNKFTMILKKYYLPFQIHSLKFFSFGVASFTYFLSYLTSLNKSYVGFGVRDTERLNDFQCFSLAT